MNVKALQADDLPEIERVHSKYYSDEFSLEEFFEKMIEGFVITDAQDKSLVCTGGIRPILEVVAITNKEHSVRKRMCALSMLLELSLHGTMNHKFNQLHAFIQDDKWFKHLTKYGFQPTVGNPLVKVL